MTKPTNTDIYYLIYKTGQTGMNVINVSSNSQGYLRAECAYI